VCDTFATRNVRTVKAPESRGIELHYQDSGDTEKAKPIESKQDLLEQVVHWHFVLLAPFLIEPQPPVMSSGAIWTEIESSILNSKRMA
jgi:hypothetical protein